MSTLPFLPMGNSHILHLTLAKYRRQLFITEFSGSLAHYQHDSSVISPRKINSSQGPTSVLSGEWNLILDLCIC